MGVYEDIEAAQATVEKDILQLAFDRSQLTNLEASAVKGGPDVSSSQGNINWTSVKGAGYDICFPKVADGDVIDSTFTAARIANIEAAGLTYAPYYYGRVASPGNQERNGRLEAAMAVYFASRQGWGRAGDLPLVYDFETLNGQTEAEAANHLLKFIGGYRGLMTHYPFIYTAPSFWNTSILPNLTADNKASVANCPLWIADWGVTKPHVPPPWDTWTFWQYTDHGAVPGVTGPVDLNRANITTSQLNALRI